jgi:hypothetical protein
MWADLIGQPTCKPADRSASALALVPALQQPQPRAAAVAQLPWRAEVVTV